MKDHEEDAMLSSETSGDASGVGLPPIPLADSQLPECRFRGELVRIVAPGSGAVRDGYECDQPHIRGRSLEPALVSPAACGECGYSDAAFAAGAQVRAAAVGVSAESYASRYAACLACGFRSANFCLRAAGDCSLTQKIGRQDFSCPERKF